MIMSAKIFSSCVKYMTDYCSRGFRFFFVLCSFARKNGVTCAFGKILRIKNRPP